MKETPALTVITPVYNGQRFIGSCLRSVIDQNCSDVEHLIIDGGSTDKTLDIIKQYAKYNAHIRWISEKDGGQSAAMNKGISLARGKIIGFLNCDDYYQPAVFSRILEIFRMLPGIDLLVGDCNVLNDEEKVVYVNKPSRLSLTNILIGGEKNQFPFNPSAYFYQRSLHKKTGPYDESDHYTMDLDFLIRAVKTARIQYVSETWGNFRFIRGTKTFSSKENGQLELNKARVKNIYLAQVSSVQRWWIKLVRFFYIEGKPRYYAGRLVDCFKDPRELTRIMIKKFKSGPVPDKNRNRVSSFMGTQR
jgi:glycosyltransferase involved in cell wall biosynthesis